MKAANNKPSDAPMMTAPRMSRQVVGVSSMLQLQCGGQALARGFKCKGMSCSWSTALGGALGARWVASGRWCARWVPLELGGVWVVFGKKTKVLKCIV